MIFPEEGIRLLSAGVVLIDKPVGPTSFQIVRRVRQALGVKKVGHAGTLDPFASGLLVVCVGRPATRQISRFMEGEKEYEATMRLGVETDSQDCEGKVIRRRSVPPLSRQRIERTLAGFIGEIMQTPPQYSALKHKGKPLYYYARQGIKVVKEPRQVVIRDIRCLERGEDTLGIRVICGKGTYIRTLAADIGEELGCGAHLFALRRLRCGNFKVGHAVPGQALDDRESARDLLREHLMPIEQVVIELDAEDGFQE